MPAVSDRSKAPIDVLGTERAAPGGDRFEASLIPAEQTK